MAGGKPQINRAERIAQLRSAQKRSDRRRKVMFGGLVIVVVGAMAAGVGIGVSKSKKSSAGNANNPTPSASIAPAGPGPEKIPLEAGLVLGGLEHAAAGSPVDGIRCDTAEQVAYHIHAHLAIYVNGTLRPVPAGIGIYPPSIVDGPGGPFASAKGGGCFYWLHTHSNDGVIHIESPTQTKYTLGQFFAVWGQPLGPNQVGGANGAVTAYVDGQPFAGDPATIPLDAHNAIQLDVGSTNPPPQPVDWAPSTL